MTVLLNPSRFLSSAPFKVKTYTGDGNDDRDITGMGLNPNLLIIKNRDAAVNWNAVDQDRGPTKVLIPNGTVDEADAPNNIQAFIDNGFQIGTAAAVNTNTEKYVAYGWEELPSYGLDIVLYTGTGVGRDIAHNLGVAPELMIIKGRSTLVEEGWPVYHSGMDGGTAPEDFALRLSATDAEVNSFTYWEDTAPDASNFHLGSHARVNENGGTFVAYLFAPVAGVSAFGGYAGTGASKQITGLGFSPNLVVIKGRDFGSPWGVYDTGRGATKRLKFNTNEVEATLAQGLTKFDSDGFTVGTNNEVNNSAKNYIWMAWA